MYSVIIIGGASMNIGIRLHDAAGNTLSEKTQNATKQGFSCCHLALSKAVSPDLMNPSCATPGLASWVNKQMNGLDIAVLGCYLNLTHPDINVYNETVKKYEAHLRLCKWLGAGVVGTETGNPNEDYHYDPLLSHTENAFSLFIDRVTPVVEIAERVGATLAIEPVYTHIVYDPEHARRVLDRIHSPNLKIIFDPSNLLHPDNMDKGDYVIDQAIDLLGDEIMIIHLKDFILENGEKTELACGLGEMRYEKILRFSKEKKPQIQMTLENTIPENAEQARLFIEAIAKGL